MDIDWAARAAAWPTAYGPHNHQGVVRQSPEDFQVREIMPVVTTGSGEHVWIRLIKRCRNTEDVSRELARFAGIAYRDVGYSGLKDFHAETEQWFSLHMPGQPDLDWSEFSVDGVELLEWTRHNRKLKRGTHAANRFSLCVHQLVGDQKLLESRLEAIKSCGIPNYFGPQRFGRNFSNMQQCQAWFSAGESPRGRERRSLLLSAARAWLFNEVLSARLANGSWTRLYPGEPANLDGSGSVFTAEPEQDYSLRLRQLDIHPTAPLCGVTGSKTPASPELHAFESDVIDTYPWLYKGLQAAGVTTRRRAIRSRVSDLTWRLENDTLWLEFELLSGQFATAVLREIIC